MLKCSATHLHSHVNCGVGTKQGQPVDCFVPACGWHSCVCLFENSNLAYVLPWILSFLPLGSLSMHVFLDSPASTYNVALVGLPAVLTLTVWLSHEDIVLNCFTLGAL